jgi:hypothetical protein
LKRMGLLVPAMAKASPPARVAWIETNNNSADRGAVPSPPARWRGLKP